MRLRLTPRMVPVREPSVAPTGSACRSPSRPRTVGSWIDVSSSKSACRRRRRAANHRKYAKLRKAGRVPRQTAAERREVAVEHHNQREVEQNEQWWQRRLTGSAAAMVSAAAVIAPVHAATDAIWHLHQSHSAVQYFNPYLRSDPERPDLPHLPEPDATYYTAFDGAGTAATNRATGPVAGRWDPWEWTHRD